MIVGVGKPADPKVHPRPTADADAVALFDLVTDPQYRGIPKSNVKLLLSDADAARGGQRATKAAVRDALRWVKQSAKAEDFVLIALIGQGAPVGDRSGLFAADSTAAGRANDALLSAEIETDLEKLQSQKLLALLDVNYAKTFTPDKNEQVVEPSLSDITKAFLPDEEKEDHALPPGRVVILGSNSAGTAPVESGKNGLFTSLVVEALKGAADKDGYEADGWVVVDELTAYLDKQFQPKARVLGTTKEAKESQPVPIGARANHFELTHNPKVWPGRRRPPGEARRARQRHRPRRRRRRPQTARAHAQAQTPAGDAQAIPGARRRQVVGVRLPRHPGKIARGRQARPGRGATLRAKRARGRQRCPRRLRQAAQRGRDGRVGTQGVVQAARRKIARRPEGRRRQSQGRGRNRPAKTARRCPHTARQARGLGRQQGRGFGPANDACRELGPVHDLRGQGAARAVREGHQRPISLASVSRFAATWCATACWW